MKKTVATFGLVSGFVATVMTLVTIPFIHSATIQTADVLGYTSMVLSALLVFFGIRSYRERAGGRVGFGRGVAVGVLITLVSCAIYATLKGLYDHPATNAALSFATSFPIGLAVTVVSAAILRRR